MIQLIFVKEGKENTFHQFEDLAICIMSDYNGKAIYCLRSTPKTFISNEKKLPYEIHFISFDSERDFPNLLKDDERQTFMHLKEASITETFLIKENVTFITTFFIHKNIIIIFRTYALLNMFVTFETK